MLDLDPKRLDWYTMYTTLSARYGEADSVSPAGAVWSSGEVRLSLERPLTVKYIDRPVFERLQEKGRAQESLKDLSRDAVPPAVLKRARRSGGRRRPALPARLPPRYTVTHPATQEPES